MGTYGEARTTLAFKMPNPTAQKLLPEGWLLSPYKDGPGKDANLIVTFMDWLVVQDQDGKPAPTYRNVGLTVPAKQTSTEATVSMVIAGLSSPGGYAPGPYGNFVAATATLAKTSRVDPDGHARAEETWEFEGESGNSIRLQLQFVRGIADKVSVNQRFIRRSSQSFMKSTGPNKPSMSYAAFLAELTGSRNMFSKRWVLGSRQFSMDRSS